MNKPIIILGISAGIAGYKIINLANKLNQDYEIILLFTTNAKKMFASEIKKIQNKFIIKYDIFSDNFNIKKIIKNKEVDHIKITKNAFIFIVAPATANIIGKLANGIADDILTTAFLAATCPKIIIPSMNVNMWNNRIVQNNLKVLTRSGIKIIKPLSGLLACGDYGMGKLVSENIIINQIKDEIKIKNYISGKNILITAGPTFEQIDPIRFITNTSSGKMGISLAEVCIGYSANILLIKSRYGINTDLPIKQLEFNNSNELQTLIKKNIRKYDMIFHTAAVSDYYVKNIQYKKINSKNSINLELTPNIKIINKIKRWNPNIILIGFKAVYKLHKHEYQKIINKKFSETNADYIALNDVGKKGIGFNSDENEVYLYNKNGDQYYIKREVKINVARKIIELISFNRLCH
jgi:phosphopantothenoylcysteine decarboxylase/phosphopantothenate--cysteine ligase